MIGTFAHFQCILFFFGKTFTIAYIGEPDGDCEISSNVLIFCCKTKQEIYCLYYNKTMFDKAGVAYPQAPWTWDDFEKTAKMLTNAQQDQYGALMRLETPHIIIKALQEQVPLYKADGTSNFDDPAFAESLKWFKELGSAKKYQLDVKQLLAEKASGTIGRQWTTWLCSFKAIGSPDC